jgi:hypothetical protein
MTEPAILVPDESADARRSADTVNRIAKILLSLLDLGNVQLNHEPDEPRLRLVK